MKSTDDTSMNRGRDLDGLLGAVREHVAGDRLMPRDDVRALIDNARDHSPAVIEPHSPNIRNLLMTMLSLVAVSTALIVVASTDDATKPVPSKVDRSLSVVASRTDSPNTSVAPSPTSATTIDGSVGSGRAKAGRALVPGSSEPRSTRVPRNSSRSEGRTAKPDIPSGGLVITRTEYDSSEAAALAARGEADGKLDIAALGYVELDKDEAARLGITLSKTGMTLYADDTQQMLIRNGESEHRVTIDNGSSARRLKRFKITIDRSSSDFKDVKIDDNAMPLAIAPVLVVNQYRTALKTEGSSLIYFDAAPTIPRVSDRELVKDGSLDLVYSASRLASKPDAADMLRSHALLGRLIPVFFRFDDGVIENTSLRKGAEVCLWYAPTPEFLAALPERYRRSIESEVSTITEVVRSNGNVEQACDRIAGKPSYLEVCRVSSGAISGATVNPNPAMGAATLSFLLKDDREVSVTLHDLGGRYLRHLAQGEALSAGERTIPLDLDKVNQGAYLVAVRSTQGEQAVARLIVQ